MCETKIIYSFCILERVDGVTGEISMNPNDQCGLCTFVFLIRLKGTTTRVKFRSFSSKPPYGFEVVKCDKHSSQVFSIRDAYLYEVKAQLDRTSYRSRHGTENQSSSCKSIARRALRQGQRKWGESCHVPYMTSQYETNLRAHGRWSVAKPSILIWEIGHVHHGMNFARIIE